MNKLIRLCYASSATFYRPENPNIEADVGRILLQSRKNNSHQKIGGVLHFGKGHFFQCLEGPPEQVEQTFGRISKDSRHRNVEILYREATNKRLFNRWSMKYLTRESQINHLLKKWGQKQFNPYTLSISEIQELLLTSANRVSAISSLPETPNTPKPWWKNLLTGS